MDLLRVAREDGGMVGDDGFDQFQSKRLGKTGEPEELRSLIFCEET